MLNNPNLFVVIIEHFFVIIFNDLTFGKKKETLISPQQIHGVINNH